MTHNMCLFLTVLIASFLSAHVSSKAFEDVQLNDQVLHRVKRIISGEVVERGEWNWLVHLKASVSYKKGSRKWWCLWLCGQETVSKTFTCGGSIIDNRYVLTAAHCVDDDDSRIRAELEKSKVFHVTSGEVDWHCSATDYIQHLWARITGDTANRCHIHATQVIRHPQYARGSENYWSYDLALLELEADILENDYTGKIDLPPTGTDENWPGEGETGYVHGWGCTHVGGEASDDARGAEIIVRSNSYCQSTFGGKYDTATHICAGGTDGVSVCSGDSGGPLVVKKDNQYCQAGVVSFFVQGRSTSQPSGFARVSAGLSWIKDQAGL